MCLLIHNKDHDGGDGISSSWTYDPCVFDDEIHFRGWIKIVICCQAKMWSLCICFMYHPEMSLFHGGKWLFFQGLNLYFLSNYSKLHYRIFMFCPYFYDIVIWTLLNHNVTKKRMIRYHYRIIKMIDKYNNIFILP